MKFSVEGSDLFEILSVGRHTLDTNSESMSANFYLQAEDDKLFVTATNLSQSVSGYCEADIEIEGETTVNGAKLHSVVQRMKNGRVEFFLGKKIAIKQNARKFMLGHVPPAEYPKLPIESGQAFTLPAAILYDALNTCSFAMSTEVGRPFLQGIYVDTKEGALVATDGHRLARCNFETNDTIEPFIVPSGAVKNIIVLLKNTKKEVTLVRTSGLLMIEIGNIVFKTKLNDGKFPPWTRLFSAETESHFTCDANAIREAVACATLVANKRKVSAVVNVFFGKESRVCTKDSHDEGVDVVHGEYEGPEQSKALNGKYCNDLFVCIAGDCRISMDGDVGPLFVQDMQNEDHVFLIMPMRQ